MFYETTAFAGDISNWDVSNVNNMFETFGGATSFNSPLGKWNTANVEYMEVMFYGASSFDQDVSSWNIEKVESFYQMFYDAESFNQNLCKWSEQEFKYWEAEEMFAGSGCAIQLKPRRTLQGPFCASNCEVGE